MTIRTTNFAPASGTGWKWIALTLWAAAALLIWGSVHSWTDARRLRAEHRQLASHLAEPAQTAAVAAGHVPDRAEMEALAARISAINVMSGPRAAPLALVLNALEDALPRGTWLRSLSYDARTGRLSFAVMGSSEPELSAALRAVEAQGAFTNVNLQRQVRVRQLGETYIQFDVGASVR